LTIRPIYPPAAVVAPGMPRGRVRIQNGTVVSDCGTLLRGGVVKFSAHGKQTGKTTYATDPGYYCRIRRARLNAVRVAWMDPWRRSKGHIYWDLATTSNRTAFLSELDRIVDLTSRYGLYALIEHHDIGTYDLDTLTAFWELVAPRYAGQSHVFYEIANEPVSWNPEDYSDQALRDQERVYRQIRELAPQTHIVLLSFANTAHDLLPHGNPMLEVVKRMSGVDWANNASVAFHPYRTLSSDIIEALRQHVPVLTTELDLPAHAGASDEPHIYTSVDGAEYAHQVMERIGVSWFAWGTDGPDRFARNFERGVLLDASGKGYLWQPDRRLPKTLADYSAVAAFLNNPGVGDAVQQMGIAWQHLAGLETLACAAAVIEGMILSAVPSVSDGPPNGTLLVLVASVGFVYLMDKAFFYALRPAVGHYERLYSARLREFIFRRSRAFGKPYVDRHGLLKPSIVDKSVAQFSNLLTMLMEVALSIPLLIVYLAMTIIWWPRSALASFLIAGFAIARLGGLLRLERDFRRIIGGLDEFLDLFHDSGKFILSGGPLEFESLDHGIQLHGLTFAYPDGKPALQDVCIIMPKGEMTALIGAEGAGKSTLGALLARYYDPPPGTIYIDDIDLRKLTMRSLRRKIALVSREIPLAETTLRDNLAAGLDRAIPDSELMRAIDESALQGLVESLPDGLETNVGAKGFSLTADERQRVLLARAFLQDPAIVIVDDADALDQQSLERLTRDRTSLVITGNLPTIKRARRVVVMDQGRVIEQGPPRALLLRRGRFFSLWTAQQFTRH
jgi:ABC-type multidrug transport system ATPase subunit